MYLLSIEGLHLLQIDHLNTFVIMLELNLDKSLENNVDPDQLIRFHTAFHSAWKYMLIAGKLEVNRLKTIWEEMWYKKIST